MRTRDLKPGFFRNTDIAALQPIVRLLYQGLWCIADKKGRLLDVPALIKADVFPLENVPVEKHLTSLAEKGFIVRYQAGERRCIWIPTFLKHQHPHPKEPESTLPPYAGEPEEATERPLPVHVEATGITRPDNGDSGKSNVASASHSNTLSSTPSIPSNDLTTALLPKAKHGARAASPYNLTAEEWSRAFGVFPGTNVLALWREWVEWIEEEEEKRRPTTTNAIAFEGWCRKKTTAPKT